MSQRDPRPFLPHTPYIISLYTHTHTPIIMSRTFLAVWIGTSNKKAKKDFNREMELKKKSETIQWDDSHRPSKIQVGDYFIFIDASSSEKKINPIMFFHKVIDIQCKRRTEWSNNGYMEGEIYDTSKRKSLILSSNVAKTEMWNEYFPTVNYKGSHLQCTTKLRLSPILER